MRDKTECARLVFQDFLTSYEEHLGSDGFWTLGTDGEDDPITGLTGREWHVGMAILIQKGLAERYTDDGWVLTDDGREVCAHPELLDDYLGPRSPFAAPVQHLTLNAQQVQNLQTGHGSIQNVTYNTTYNTVLQQLVKDIEASDAPPEKKSEWIGVLHDILSNPLTQTAITLAGTAFLQK